MSFVTEMATFNLLFFFVGFYVNAEEIIKEDLLSRVIDSVSKITNYFKIYSEEANLDGIFGIFVAEAQISVFLDNILNNCFPNELSKISKFIRRLYDIKNETNEILFPAIASLKRRDAAYFQNVGDVLFKREKWYHWGRLRNTNKSLLYQSRDPILPNGLKSDNCIHEWNHNCNISLDCWHYATEAGHNDYYITHQYLYLLIGKLYGCEAQMDALAEKYNKSTTERFLQIFCTNILQDANISFQNKSSQDLFMEQVGLCGIVGFHEFFQTFWIETIISWQRPSGCFFLISDESHETNVHRLKRNEKEMSHGCLSHQTTVGLLALQQAIRYLMEPHLNSICQRWE